jgi:hypothetical protein
MVTKLSIAIGMCIGSGMAQPDLQTFKAAPASATRIDFDQVFADVTRQADGYQCTRLIACRASRPFCPSLRCSPTVPLASPFTDPILGRIVGRCDA